jgi:hypothetical protein
VFPRRDLNGLAPRGTVEGHPAISGESAPQSIRRNTAFSAQKYRIKPIHLSHDLG